MPDPGATIRLTVAAPDAGLRLDQFLARRVPSLSRSQAHRLIRDGRVTAKDTSARPALVVWTGLDVVVRIPPPAETRLTPEALPLDVLYEDADVAVINKAAGMVVHPGAGHRGGTLVNALLHRLGELSGAGGTERPGIVHRLDRGTSGALVVARHDRAHRALAAQFQARQVVKEYLALVWGTVRPGQTLTQPIGRDPRHRTRMSSRARRSRPAETRVLSCEPLGGVSLVRVAIGTGRTHQIRVHLSEAGHPVVGDALYGGVRRSVPPRLAALVRLRRPFLHAARLGFAHPADGRPLTVDAPLPGDLAGVLAALRRASGRRSPDSQEVSR